MDRRALAAFRGKVWEFYREQGREYLPWRQVVTPYGVFVSEIMLQQTQVSRVLERYGRWLGRFPGFAQLAAAPTREVLDEWQGLGYNRRALWLKAAADMVAREYGGALPREVAELVKLPGVGPHTAGSMAAFAYEEPTVFIETNIRRGFIHEFFDGREGVSDAELRLLVEAAVQAVVADDRESPREWYWALMDYGSDLAKRVPNPNRRSKHYAVQAAFEGSVRQLRGEVLRRLLAGPKTVTELAMEDSRLEAVLVSLEREGFVRRQGNVLMLVE
jgi:A/G-specific adenine glycosylase